MTKQNVTFADLKAIALDPNEVPSLAGMYGERKESARMDQTRTRKAKRTAKAMRQARRLKSVA